ncbi:Prostaglandin reductase 1 [Bulinus truncatus]|nr:Prostaglandin reductase 1 [Bulinus truncatus]
MDKDPNISAVSRSMVTAYLSFLDRCDPKPGEVIVVSAASGAVGAIVGQLAKLKGLTVIGIAGSADKCEYIKDIGYDVAINYKTDDISGALDKAAPSGVDIYYDNVGGEISDTVYSKLRENGRVLICGQISVYNRPAEEIKKATNWNYQILFKELTVRGFKVSSPTNLVKYPAARQELITLIQKGQLKTKEDITEGFENMPAAFLGLFTGANLGKAIVKA